MVSSSLVEGFEDPGRKQKALGRLGGVGGYENMTGRCLRESWAVTPSNSRLMLLTH